MNEDSNDARDYEVTAFHEFSEGKWIKIDSFVGLKKGAVDISKYIAKPTDELEEALKENYDHERNLQKQIMDSIPEWEATAAETQRLDLAIRYKQIPASEHTNNVWKCSDRGEEISNAVYRMRINVEISTGGCFVSWFVSTNAPEDHIRLPGNYKIAGQNCKRFFYAEAARRYVEGRKKAYAHLFEREFPEVPREYRTAFMVDGLLLPGYHIQDDEQIDEQQTA